MATAHSEMTAAELLYFYVGMRLQNGGPKQSVQQILRDFPAYLQQRETMRGMIREVEDEIATGRSGALNLEQAIDEVVRELATEGVQE